MIQIPHPRRRDLAIRAAVGCFFCVGLPLGVLLYVKVVTDEWRRWFSPEGKVILFISFVFACAVLAAFLVWSLLRHHKVGLERKAGAVVVYRWPRVEIPTGSQLCLSQLPEPASRHRENVFSKEAGWKLEFTHLGRTRKIFSRTADYLALREAAEVITRLVQGSLLELQAGEEFGKPLEWQHLNMPYRERLRQGLVDLPPPVSAHFWNIKETSRQGEKVVDFWIWPSNYLAVLLSVISNLGIFLYSAKGKACTLPLPILILIAANVAPLVFYATLLPWRNRLRISQERLEMTSRNLWFARRRVLKCAEIENVLAGTDDVKIIADAGVLQLVHLGREQARYLHRWIATAILQAGGEEQK